MIIQNHIRKTLHTRPALPVQYEIKSRVDFLKQCVLNAGKNGFVVGLSGGQDSTLVGKLAQLAVTELQNEGLTDIKFHGMLLPYHEQADIDDAKFIASEFIGADCLHMFNIGSSVDALVESYSTDVGEVMSDFTKGNSKARMRMIAQYALAAEKNLLVLGTSNAAEEVTGFATKYGDLAYDVAPNADLTKRQGKALLKHLGLAESFLEKTPTADLLDSIPGQSDEVELGVSYEMIDDYLEGKEIPEEFVERIETLYINSEHKRRMPVTIWG